MLLIPFIRSGGSIATGHIKEPSVVFSLPFGNNGSNAVNLSAGMNFDFAETVEIGTEVGYSHFFAKKILIIIVRQQTYCKAEFSLCNTGTRATRAIPLLWPANWQHTIFLIGCHSAIQWVYVHHRKDHVTLINPDPAFINIDDNNPLAKCQ